MQHFYTATGFLTKSFMCLFTIFIVWPASLAGLLLASYMAITPISPERLIAEVVDSLAEFQALGPATEGGINYLGCETPSTIVPLGESNAVPAPVVLCEKRAVTTITNEHVTATFTRLVIWLYAFAVMVPYIVLLITTGRLFPFFSPRRGLLVSLNSGSKPAVDHGEQLKQRI